MMKKKKVFNSYFLCTKDKSNIANNKHKNIYQTFYIDGIQVSSFRFETYIKYSIVHSYVLGIKTI
jgi:hypothetical protein